ncbi:MAG TPA: hypothetical protein VFQ25_02385 [Ktedonobacterales bacterium]|nr:hypothetical protein [Ktedonobacterales bacterium]
MFTAVEVQVTYMGEQGHNIRSFRFQYCACAAALSPVSNRTTSRGWWAVAWLPEARVADALQTA